MKLTAAQYGALHQLKEFGPENAVEVAGPPAMTGERKWKLTNSKITAATVEKLSSMGLVAVSRGEVYQPTDATGRKGNKRRNVCISITSDGLTAV